MNEPQLKAGERRTAADGDLLALSPKPVKTGAQAADSTDWIRRKNDIWMDLQGGNLVFAAEFSLMFLSLGILALALVGFLPSLITWSERGYFDWGMPVSYTHLRAHETDSNLVCRLLLEKKQNKT